MVVDPESIHLHAKDHHCCSSTVIAVTDGLVDAIAGRQAAEKIISLLVKHIDEMTHVTHRAYHGGHPGYFHCPMYYCIKSTKIARELESY